MSFYLIILETKSITSNLVTRISKAAPCKKQGGKNRSFFRPKNPNQINYEKKLFGLQNADRNNALLQ